MSDYTPSTDEVRFGYAESVSPGRESLAVPGFDRWLESVRAQERERIAQAIETMVPPHQVLTAPQRGLVERAARIAREGA